MNNHIIELVLQDMQPTLSPTQLKELRAALVRRLRQVDNSSNYEENDQLISTFLMAKSTEGCSSRTLDYYRSTISQAIQTIAQPIQSITTDTLRSFLKSYEQKHHAGKVTIDNIRRILNSFFSWLEDEDYIVKSPMRKIKHIKAPMRVKETISDTELEALRDGCTNKRDLAIIDLLSSTGMRVGELVRLNRSDINFQERECVVVGKGNKERKVYFDARTELHLNTYLQERNDQSEALFTSLRVKGKRLSIGAVERAVRELGRSEGTHRVHPHKFRRTLATNAIDKGMPIEQVQTLLGHAKIETTMHYALVSQQNVKASHRRYLG